MIFTLALENDLEVFAVITVDMKIIGNVTVKFVCNIKCNSTCSLFAILENKTITSIRYMLLKV